MPTVNSNIDQAAESKFQKLFWTLSEQDKSKLEGSGAIYYMPSDGKTQNLARMGGLELIEVEGRNPRKQYSDYAVDNRMMTKRRFTVSVLLDKKDDINELITDPTNPLIEEMIKAKKRSFDRVSAAAGISPVLIGAPNTAPRKLSAIDDGVVFLDATSGLNYQTYTKITQKFINNNVDIADIEKVNLLITGTENTQLMDDDKFINSRYVNARPVEKGIMDKAGVYGTVLFAGSEAGGIVVNNPILPETATERYCMALAPKSIAVSMELGKLEVEPAPEYVNSKCLTIDLWINAMRTEGARVVVFKTTK